MRKCALYCTLCIVCGVLFLLHGYTNKSEMHTYTPPVYTVPVTHDYAPKADIDTDVVVPDILELLDTSNDIHMVYTHSITVSGENRIIDYVGTRFSNISYNGCVISIHSDYSSSMLFTEDDYVLTIDDEDVRDTELYEKEYSYLRSNTETVKFIVSVLSSDSDTKSIINESGTSYSLISESSVQNGELLHVTEDGVHYAEWYLYVPDSREEFYRAEVHIYPNSNSQGIECESYRYEFEINTGYVGESQ